MACTHNLQLHLLQRQAVGVFSLSSVEALFRVRCLKLNTKLETSKAEDRNAYIGWWEGENVVCEILCTVGIVANERFSNGSSAYRIHA